MSLTEIEARVYLAAPKIARGPLTWILKPQKDAGEWYEARASVAFENEPKVTLDGVHVILQFRKSVKPKSDIVTFGLVIPQRICAVDVQPDDDHKNNKGGDGKSLYGQWVGGIHIHRWSDDGYGYAEPCAINGVEEYAKAWELFQAEAGIRLDGDINWPEALRQPELFT